MVVRAREYAKITPDFKPHSEFEQEITKYLEEKGFYVAMAPYHNWMPQEIKLRLSRIFTPNAIYIRSRADRLAIHKTKPIVFEWEAKTHASRTYHDMTLEIIPIFNHIIQSQMDVECLYIYRDPYTNPVRNIGFWIHKIPPIRVIMIPNRWNNEIRKWYENKIRFYWPSASIKPCGSTMGTNDPFLIIDKSYLQKMRHWKDLIDERLKEERKIIQIDKINQKSFYEIGREI